MSALDENPNCAQTYASFLLVGDQLDPAEVARVLPIEPTGSWPKGMIRPFRSGIRVCQRTGVWDFSTDGVLVTTSLERHLRYLLDKLEPFSSEVRKLVQQAGLEAAFSCFWVSATGHGGPVFSPEVLARISSLGSALWLDLYGLTEIEVET